MNILKEYSFLITRIMWSIVCNRHTHPRIRYFMRDNPASVHKNWVLLKRIFSQIIRDVQEYRDD